MPAEGADVARAGNGALTDFALKREVQRHRIRCLVLVKRAAGAADRRVTRPINRRVRVRRGRAISRDSHGELLDVLHAGERAL
jgi:hypothetical protein